MNFYTSTVIQEMLNDDKQFRIFNILNKDYFSLGTPEQIKQYEYPLLMDLDGTLVNTDNIYVEVWEKILEGYGLHISSSFFDNFIKGKSDITFLNYLIPKLTKEDIETISNLKDTMFVDKLNHQDSNILLDGVAEFFEINKNRQIAIVTSCNRKSAEFILKKTRLDNYIQILIASEDSVNHKPNAEPYINAIKALNTRNDKCIIFEDSCSGYYSAKNAEVFKICLIENNNSSIDIKNADEFKIKDFKNFDIDGLLNSKNTNNNQNNSNNPNNINNHIDSLYKVLKYLPIKNIKQNKTNLKTGYICDIKSYELQYNNNTFENIVLKISNFDNELSKTAVKLNMYKNETNFYNSISQSINEINIPKFYGKFEYNEKDGIILENLHKYDGTFNIDLNKNINLLLSVVNNIFKVHHKFHCETSNDIIDNMKNLPTINKISYYSELINSRFNKFIVKSNILLTPNNKRILTHIHNNFQQIIDESSTFPLTFCHGDLKSPNIFYKDNTEPYFLDWQYVHLNKGVSDIVFLLVESINFEERIVNIVINYYYNLLKEKLSYSYDDYMKDLKNALCIFPFFVCVWFNSEDSDKLLDSVFPIRFLKNVLKYYDYFLK